MYVYYVAYVCVCAMMFVTGYYECTCTCVHGFEGQRSVAFNFQSLCYSSAMYTRLVDPEVSRDSPVSASHLPLGAQGFTLWIQFS